jgi:hypothetical protein
MQAHEEMPFLMCNKLAGTIEHTPQQQERAAAGCNPTTPTCPHAGVSHHQAHANPTLLTVAAQEMLFRMRNQLALPGTPHSSRPEQLQGIAPSLPPHRFV